MRIIQTVERVAKRVSEGGHDIPENVARRRFERSWTNFRDLYREIADDWQVYDNSGCTRRTMGHGKRTRGVRKAERASPRVYAR